MKKIYVIALFPLFVCSFFVRAQTNINVVFHVVYNTSPQNIVDSCLQDQLDVLNEDFNALNTDLWKVPAAWVPIIGNMNVHFQLATLDPSGNSTTGIERRQYPTTSWTTNDNVKHYTNGGLDAWPDTSYLNIWVCNLANGLLGYTQFPGGASSTDGVVLHYRNVGRGNYAQTPYNLGRAGTHEVGHWFGLKHFGPDAGCADLDGIADTPPFSSNSIYGGFNPFQVITDACNPSAPGVMWMNFMTYVDDSSMYFFTQGQVDTMTWVMNNMRQGSGSLGMAHAHAEHSFSVFPSPSINGHFTLEVSMNEMVRSVSVFNSIGQNVTEISITDQVERNIPLDLSFLPTGIYTVAYTNESGTYSKRICISR